MLKSLLIQNLATIESLEITFDSGLNVLTGETGAGKSILLGGLGLALGERAQGESIRPGAKLAVVEAIFAPEDPAAVRRLLTGELELEYDPDNEDLVVRREISRTGRNRCFIGGQMIGVADLKRLGELLVDFHGQHENQSLFRAGSARDALDAFAGNDKVRSAYDTAWLRLTELRRRRRELEAAARDYDQRADYLDFQLDEFDKLAPETGEIEALEAEEARLAHAESLAESAAQAYALLYDGLGDDQPSALALLREVERRVGEIAEIDADYNGALEQLAEQQNVLEDLAARLRDYGENAQGDPRRLNEVIERMEGLRRLVRKHGGSEAAMFEAVGAMRAEREQMSHDAEDRETIERDLVLAEKSVREAGAALSESRAKSAGKLAKRVREYLKDLAMEKARFEAVMEPLNEPGADGLERVELMLAANPGLPPAPLRKVASGGELSRVMLALKSTLAARDAIPTLVFDEIDVGLSGETARRVGLLMRELTGSHQILCITHHAPIAACAARHIHVSKTAKAAQTYTHAEVLDKLARLEAIARMMGGDAATEAGLELARKLIEKG